MKRSETFRDGHLKFVEQDGRSLLGHHSWPPAVPPPETVASQGLHVLLGCGIGKDALPFGNALGGFRLLPVLALFSFASQLGALGPKMGKTRPCDCFGNRFEEQSHGVVDALPAGEKLSAFLAGGVRNLSVGDVGG
jgi:hypothetical protein